MIRWYDEQCPPRPFVVESGYCWASIRFMLAGSAVMVFLKTRCDSRSGGPLLVFAAAVHDDPYTQGFCVSGQSRLVALTDCAEDFSFAPLDQREAEIAEEADSARGLYPR